MKKELRQYRATPPKGFVLDQDEPTQSNIKLPQGFTLDSDKKKVGSQNLSTSSNTQANTNLSLGGEKNQVSQADKNALANFAQNLNKGNGQNVVKKLPTQNQITQVKPKRILTSEEVEKKAQERLNDPYNQLASNNSDDPIGSYYNTIQNSKALSVKGEDKIDDANEAAIHDKMSEMIVNNGFSNAKSASDYLYNQVKKVTGREVPINKVSIDELKKVLPNNLSTEAALKKVAANQYIGSIMDESKNFDDFIQKYPSLSQKFSDINQSTEEGKAQAYNLILNDPDVIEAAKDRPEIWKQYLQERNNFNNKFPDLAKQQIASKISQYREDIGKNNKIFNNPSKESWDKVVDQMYKEGKIDASDKAFYNQNITPSDLKTTGLLESTWRGYEQGVRQIGQTIGLQDLGLLKDMSKESQVNPTKNLILGGGGNLMGNIVPMLLTGGALKGVGFGEKAANSFAAMLQFGGGNAEQSKKYFPNNPIGQFAYTTLGTTIDAMLMDLPTRAQQGIKQFMSGEAKVLAAKLSDKSISDAVKEQMKQSFVNKFIGASKRYGIDILKHNAQTAGVLTGIDLLHKGLNLAAGDKNAFEGTDVPQELIDNFMMATPLSALSAVGGAFSPKQKSELNTAINELPENMYTGEIKKALNDGNVSKLETYLKDVAEQLSNPQSETFTRKVFGEKLSDIATKLFPNAKSEPIAIDAIPTTNEAGAEVRDTENEQGTTNTVGDRLHDSVSGSEKNVGDKERVDKDREQGAVQLYESELSLDEAKKLVQDVRDGKVTEDDLGHRLGKAGTNTIWAAKDMLRRGTLADNLEAAIKTKESEKPTEGKTEEQKVQDDINNRQEFINGLKNKRDSEDFKYTTEKQTDYVTGSIRTVKRLKTKQELEASTKKINDAISKAENELSELKSKQAGVNTTDNGLQDGNSGSGKDVGGEKVDNNKSVAIVDNSYNGINKRIEEITKKEDEVTQQIEDHYKNKGIPQGIIDNLITYGNKIKEYADIKPEAAKAYDESIADLHQKSDDLTNQRVAHEAMLIDKTMKDMLDSFRENGLNDAGLDAIKDYFGKMLNYGTFEELAKRLRWNKFTELKHELAMDIFKKLYPDKFKSVDYYEDIPDNLRNGIDKMVDNSINSFKEKLINDATNEIPISTENQSNTIKEANTVEQPTSEGEKTSQPIETEPIRKSNEGQPPSKEPPVESGGGTKPPKGNKALATRLVEASNVSEEAKSGIAEKGLKYEPKSQKEAEQIAKSVIDEIGIDDAVDKARAQTFGGDVNTLIQTEALNRLKELEDAAKTPEEKRAYAEKFAEVSIALDEWARDKAGRGISALNFFYKKSPLGIQIAENVKRGEAFKEWSKNKEQSWKEFFDELRKEPDFEKEVQEVVGKEVKAERAKERAERKEKVHKAIDDTMAKWAKKLKAKGTDDAQKQGIGVDEVFKAAAATMKKAYDAGEAVVKIVNDAIEYISKQLGRDDWGKEEFKKEWEQRLADKKAKKKLTDEELKARVIDKFRKKLKGLSDKEKEEVVRRAFKELVENGALEYDDFKKIISDVTGRGEMTPDEAKRLRELVEQTNNVEKAAKELQEKRTDEAFIRYRTAMLDAAKATKDLNDMLWNKPDVTRRLTSIMQLNTLGIPSLVANVTYNVWNQMLARLPIGIINDTIDRALAGAAKLVGKSYEREYNVWETQGAFFKGLGLGTKESAEQFLTGLNRQDLFQKEIYGQQIRPFRAIRDLFAWGRGKKNLSKQEAVDKSLQATVGIPAELVARALNIGDKPLRFGAESVQGKAFAISLGLKGMDYKLFMEFPKEEAYRAYKKKGLSDAEASKNADYIKAAIEQEGKRSTFQQDNLLNDLLNRMFGGQKSGVGQLAKAVIVSPYIKIPSNAFWSGYNIVNPEIAFLQAMYHGARAFQARNRGDNFSRMQLREARYWFAHGVVGIALRATIIPMVQAGIFNTQNTKDDTKKEREGEQNYEQQGAINLTKLMVYLRGGDPSKIKGGLTLSNRWLGQGGSVANSIARKYEDMTPEQREKQLDFWDYSFGGLEKEGLQELQNGVFSNTSAILTAIDSKGSFGFDQYFRNIAGMMENTAHPAMFAQIERNHLDYVPQYKGDSFIGELKNDILTRSAIVRKLSGRYPPAKISIWGEPLMKPDNTLMRLFGISRTNEGNFAYPIYEDAKKTGDIGFFPPAVSPNLYGQKLNLQQQNVLQTYVGQARKSLIAPYVNDGAYIEGFEKKYSEIKDVEVKKMVLGYLYETGRIQGVKKFLDENPQFKKTDPTTYEEEINDNYDEFKAAVKERQPTE